MAQIYQEEKKAKVGSFAKSEKQNVKTRSQELRTDVSRLCFSSSRIFHSLGYMFYHGAGHQHSSADFIRGGRIGGINIDRCASFSVPPFFYF